MRISEHFSRHEVACKCGCGFEVMHPDTLMLADRVREFVGAPIVPSSGARCSKYNRKIGSSNRSQHPLARAMDLPVPDPRAVFDWLCETWPDQYGFGLYTTFVHVDSRPGNAARWGG